jgi:hypothetical protein
MSTDRVGLSEAVTELSVHHGVLFEIHSSCILVTMPPVSFNESSCLPVKDSLSQPADNDFKSFYFK